MDAVKRVLAGLFLLGLSAAGVYGYTLSERERTYRQKIADGDAALARDNTAGAIEAFSGAITLKPDSMLGYLKRGQTYRRRGEFVAAIRDLRRASEIDPTATRPLEELGDAYLADTPHRYGSAAERFQAYVKLDNRAPRVLYKLAFARYNDGRSVEAIDALQRAIALDERFAEAYYLLGLCHRDAQHPDLARTALERVDRAAAGAAARARRAGGSLRRAGPHREPPRPSWRRWRRSTPARRARSRSASPTRAPASPIAPSSRSAAPPSAIPIIPTPMSRSAASGSRSRRRATIASR